MKRWIMLAVACSAALLMLAAPLRALGGEEEHAVQSEGACNMGAVWKLVIEPEVGVKLEATIESGVPDQDWHIVLLYNKHVLLDVVETTEEDGGFEIFKVENNALGDDIATVQATNLVNGQVCWGRLKAEL